MSRDFGSILRGDTGYSAQNSGGTLILAQSAIAKAVTGTLAETELGKVIIPGGLLGPNGVLELTIVFSVTPSANAKFITLRFGNILIANLTPGAATASGSFVFVIRNRGTVNSQITMAGGTIGGSSSSPVVATAIDTSVDQVLSLTGTLANAADTITLEAYTVRILNPL